MEDFKHLNSYELLGVSHDASLDEIKRAYRQQVARYHPDHYSKASPAEQAYASERTQHINQAYDSLVDLRKRTAASRERLEQARSKQESDVAGSRDYQAELYEQASEHLNAGRFVQAAATLRELQQINPFYRDSASLLARAKAGIEGKIPTAQSHAKGASSSTPAQPNRISLLVVSLGVLVVVGIAAAFFVLPQFAANSANTPPAAIPTATTPVNTAPDMGAVPSVAPSQPTSVQSDSAQSDTTSTGSLLLSYDFSADDTWANERGEHWAVGSENGMYRISMQPGNGSLWSYQTAPQGTEYRVQTDVQVSGGGAAGLVAHVVDEQNYVALLVDPMQGVYQLLHYQQGTASLLAKETSPLINTGASATNRLEVLLEGNLVQVFINDTPITIHHIETLTPTNTYGLIAVASDAVMIAQFDNLEIRTVR